MRQMIYKKYFPLLFLLFVGCAQNSDIDTNNPYFENGKISCNGYNASFENITNAFDNNSQTYTTLSLSDNEVSFINLVVDVTKNTNVAAISKVYIKADDSYGKTIITTTKPDIRGIERLVSRPYDKNIFNLDKTIEVNSTCRLIHFYFSSSSRKRIIKIYSIDFYDEHNNRLVFDF